MLVPTDRVERRRESASKHRLGLIIVGCRRRAAEAVSAGITITIDESGDIDACDVLAYLALGNDVEAGRVEVGRPRRARTLWRWRELPLLIEPVTVVYSGPPLAAGLIAAGSLADEPSRPAWAP